MLISSTIEWWLLREALDPRACLEFTQKEIKLKIPWQRLQQHISLCEKVLAPDATICH